MINKMGFLIKATWILWILAISYSVIIHNITIIPTMSNRVALVTVLATILISLGMIMLPSYYKIIELDLLKKEMEK